MLRKIVKKVNRELKILAIRKIVQNHYGYGMSYYGGEFQFGGGMAFPKTREQRKKDYNDYLKKREGYSEYRKLHGYDEGSYMDKINKRYGGIEGIIIDCDYITPLGKLGLAKIV